MLPFNPATFIPQYIDHAMKSGGEIGERRAALQAEARARDAQALEARSQTESERSNLVSESQSGQQLAINQSMEKRTGDEWKKKLKQSALDLHRSGRIAEAEAVWEYTGEPVPDWGGPQALSPPTAAPQAAMQAVDEAMALPPTPPGMLSGPPAPPEPSYAAGEKPADGSVMEFGVEEADAAMADMPPAPPGMVPQHIPDEAIAPNTAAAPAAPPPKPPGLGDRLKDQYGNEVASVQTMFDQLAANEGPINQGLANQIRSMAASAMDTGRQSGKTPMEVAEMLIELYRSQARGQYSLENTRLRQKKGGGGKGRAGLGFGDEMKVFDRVRAVSKDAGMDEKAAMMNQAEAALDNSMAQASSPNALGQVQSLAGLVKANFGAASSNTELKTILNAGGMETRAIQFFNNWVDGGQVPKGMIEQLKKEFAQVKARLDERRRQTAQKAYSDVYNAGIPGMSEEQRVKHAQWAGNKFMRGGEGGWGTADDTSPGSTVEVEGEEYEIQGPQ